MSYWYRQCGSESIPNPRKRPTAQAQSLQQSIDSFETDDLQAIHAHVTASLNLRIGQQRLIEEGFDGTNLPKARLLKIEAGFDGKATVTFTAKHPPSSGSSSSTPASSSSSEIVCEVSWGHEGGPNPDAGGDEDCAHSWSFGDEQGTMSFDWRMHRGAGLSECEYDGLIASGLREGMRRFGSLDAAANSKIHPETLELNYALTFLRSLFSAFETDKRPCFGMEGHAVDWGVYDRIVPELVRKYKLKGSPQKFLRVLRAMPIKWRSRTSLPKYHSSIYVRGVSKDIFQEDVLELLTEPVRNCVVMVAPEGWQGKEWLVGFTSFESAQSASEQLKGRKVKDHTISTDKPKISTQEQDDIAKVSRDAADWKRREEEALRAQETAAADDDEEVERSRKRRKPNDDDDDDDDDDEEAQDEEEDEDM